MEPKPVFITSRDIAPTALRRIADAVLNLVYPDRCLACSMPVVRQQDCGLCAQCWQKTLRLEITHPFCPSCGIPYQTFGGDEDHLCGSCSSEMPSFSGARSFGYYTGELRMLVHNLKFNRRRNLSRLLSPLLAQTFVNNWHRSEVDLIVPVPLHPRRRRERGFNQAAVLAHGLSRLLAVPMSESALCRVSYTLPQVGLTDLERIQNVRRAFAARNSQTFSGRRILLLDDVMTTGATVRSACKALLEGGALRVSVLTLARAVPGIE